MTTLSLDQRRVTVLYAHRLSPYWDLPVDVFDERRDARSFSNPGRGLVIAHPPCRLWSRMRHLSTALGSESEHAFFALDQVRQYGGVLEHPAYSAFWDAAALPRPDRVRSRVEDEYGGWTLTVSQKWWGHRCEKLTWLYIVGCSATEIPELPLVLGQSSHVCAGGQSERPVIDVNERNLTPVAFAWWLEELASRCSGSARARAESE